MTKYLIVDDEHIAHDIIKGYCDMLPSMQFLKSCYDAMEALDFLRSNPVDLIFLDLNLPGLKGFDFLRTLSHPSQVIVTTAYSEHALEGYELNVTDYLLKPFGIERFIQALNKTMSATHAPTTDIGKGSDSSGRIFLKGDKKYTQVNLNDILYIEAAGNYTKVVTTKEELVVREKISTMITTLPASEFLQVHKSFAVAIPHINSIEGNRLLVQGHKIPIGKLYKMNVNELIRNQ